MIYSETYPQTPLAKTLELIPQAIYGDSDYGNVLKDYENVFNIEKEDIEEFKQEYYTADNIKLWLCGRFSKNHVKILKEIFEKFERENSKRKKAPTKSKGKDIIEKISLENLWFSKNFKIEKPKEKEEFLKQITMEWCLMAGNAFFSPVYSFFRKKGLSYSPCFIQSVSYPDEVIFSLILRDVPNKNIEEVENCVDEFFEKLKSYEFWEKGFLKSLENRVEFFYAYTDFLIPYVKFEKMNFLLKYQLNLKDVKKGILEHIRNPETLREIMEKFFNTPSRRVVLL